MKKPLQLKQVLAALLTIAALASGLTAQATVQAGIMMQGLARTVNNQTMCSFVIQSEWGGDQIPAQTGSSYTFSNARMIHGTANVTLNGTLNFQVGTAFADVITSGSFTVTIESSSLWFYGATVQTKSGSNVSGCSASVSSNNHTLTVTIPSGKTFGAIIVDYVVNQPFSNSNTTISGVGATYIYQGSAIAPVPTVTYNGTVLNAGSDYTVNYANNNGPGTATLTVTGTGEYAGTLTRNYTIRNVALSDFNSLGNNTYEIANKDDLDRLALLVDYAANDCQGITFRQTADITYSHGSSTTENNFTQIGGYFGGSDKNFGGTYDGQNHTISGIRVYKNPTNTGNAYKNVALFGRISGATIKNVILTDARITGYRYVGGLVGNNVGGTVQNCLVISSTITCGNTYVGALIGGNSGTLTTNHYRNCTVNDTANATNVGVGNGSSSQDVAGARSMHPLTIQNANVTVTGESVTYQNTTYYASNTTITLGYNNPPAGYQVTYSLNGTALSGNTFTMPANDNATVNASTSLITYTITYNLDGGSVATANPTSYNVTTNTFTLNNPTKTGYTFAGWTGTDLTEATQAVTIAQGSMGDRSYTANWTLITYNITYDLDGGSVVTANPTTYNITTNDFTLNNPTKTGYTFAGWTGTDLTQPTLTVTIAQGSTGNRSYTANWTPINYNITYNLDGGEATNPTTYTIETPTFTLNNPTKTGYTFTGWTGSNGTTPQTTVTITQGSTGDLSYTATWTIITYNITYDLDGGSVATANPTTYTVETPTFTLNNPTKTGYTFDGWTGTDLTQPTQTVTITQGSTGDLSYTAHWTIITYNITYDLDGGSVATANPTTYDVETPTFTLINPTKVACNFDGWTGSNGQTPETTVTITQGSTGDLSYTAHWTPFAYALTLGEGITASGTVAVTDNGINYYAPGTEITLAYSGTIPEGYNPAYSVNGNAIVGNTFEMPAADAVVEAVLLERYYIYNSTTGELALLWGAFNKDNKWGDDVPADEVTSVSATDEVNFTGDCSNLFNDFYNCTSMDLSNVNTEGVTNMGGMFQDCSSLTTLNLTSWDVSNVTNMINMFYDCSSLTTLDLSGWNTAAVTNMNNMFNYCRNLETLDLSGWNTGNVTDMSCMFFSCSSLDSLDLSGWNTATVTNMSNMFCDCWSLDALDLSGWNTANVTTMSWMFRGCAELTTIYAGTGWSTASVTLSGNMFFLCTSLVGGLGTEYDEDYIDAEYARIDHGEDEPGYLTGVFALTLADDITASPAATLTHDSVNYYAAGTTITLSYGGEVPEGYGPVYSVNGNSFSGNSFEMPFEDASVTVEVQRLRYTFINGELALLYGEFNSDNKWGSDVSASAVTSVTATDEVSFTGDCSSLFAYFTNCTSMDLSNVNTENVTNIADMFNHCTSLTTLDLTGWNTTNVTDMNNMFFYCSVLETLEGISGWDVSNVTNMNRMFAASEGLATLDLSSWNTSNVTDMAFMFYACTNLATLDIANWDTEGVTDMSYMFTGCHNIETLDLSSWNTSNVTNMTFMFIDCPLLTTIYVGEGWSTENVTSSTWMFYDCTSLVGGMGTQYDEDYIEAEYARIDHGEDEPGYLTGVFALTLADDITASPVATVTHDSVNYYAAGTTIMLSYSGNVPEGYAPIYSMNGTPLSGNRFEMPLGDATVTVDVQPARYTYDSTTGELALIWGEFNKDFKWGDDVTPTAVTSVTATDEVSFTGDCYRLFYNFSNCTSMDLSKVNTDSVTSMYIMFAGCRSLNSLDISSWNTANVTNMGVMFQVCQSLETLDISSWDVSNVTNMGVMFDGCTSLKTLDLSGWNTSNVTYMSNMFFGCTSLETVNLSGWSIGTAQLNTMFLGCTNLTTVDLSGWTIENATGMGNMFTNCSSLTTLDVSDWNIVQANMSSIFCACSLTTLDLSTWNTAGVTNMSSMFAGSTNLTTIYVGEGWTTENVTSSGGMFSGCTNLVGGMGTTYDAEHTDAEYAHIDGGIWEPGYFTARFDPIEYIDADGNTQTCTDYIVLEGSDDFIRYGHDNVEAWYVVNHNVTYNASVMFRGGVNLILVDGATLNLVNESEDLHSMYCNESLTVYVQSGGTGAIVGNNVVISSPQAIIHGGHFTLSDSNYSNALQMSDLTINGGIISAETNRDAIIADLLTINGGTVSATVTEDGNAIYADDVVVINGGVVTTTNQQDGVGIYGSNNVTINGGIVTANASGYYDGIFTYGTIMLGWTNESDRITASSYYGDVTVATGQAFSDETGHYYMNTLTDDQRAAIAGQTLSPFTDFGATFSITYETDGGTLPEGYPATYTFAETVTLPIPAKEENTFVGWYDNATFEGDPITEIEAGTALGDKTFYAYWLPKYTDVTYLDADGQPQTVRATILYNNETYTGVYEGGVYTVSDSEGGYAFYDLLRFTGDATLILPDGGFLGAGGAAKGATDSEEYGLFVEGNLTIYGQEKGNGYIESMNCEVDGNVNIYGDEVVLYNLTTNADSDINLSWTGLENYIIINPTQGNVHLLKDFISYSFDEEWEQTIDTILHAGEPVSIADLCNHALYPYIETIDVSYIDENGDEHIAHDAQVLWGNETSLLGGTYTFINSRLQFDHEVTFDGNTTIIVPDYKDITLSSDITVNGDLAIFGQEERSGYFGSYSEDGIHATGDVIVSNVYSDIYKIFSGGNLLIAGGNHDCGYLGANGTITLGYLTEDDEIQAYDYEGTVVIRAGQTMISYWFEDLYSGTLTPEQVAEIGELRLMPYLTPITITVEGYGDGDGGWKLIASPLRGSIAPTEVENMLANDYDLYYFDQTEALEWQNYEANSFDLESGKGYLYANNEDVTLTFNGVAYIGNGEVTLSKTTGTDWEGWNLVGNPFNEIAYLADGRGFYTMNSDGSELMAVTSGSIEAMEGIFVIANNDSETLTFTTTEPANNGKSKLALNLSRGNSVIDRAIVRFNEGDLLPKFQLNRNSTKVYIPQDGKDYAIVNSETQGEIPVSFKAKENGSYTISVNTEGVEMGYLHLIDNLTGADIDLLSTQNVIAGEDPQSPMPSYTFTANTTDYASRFKLVFSANNEDGPSTGSGAFAYINNGEIIVTNASADAVLQVVDVTGRIVVSRQGDAMNRVSTSGMMAGVYVLRLINGNDVKTQKIVIE